MQTQYDWTEYPEVLKILNSIYNKNLNNFVQVGLNYLDEIIYDIELFIRTILFYNYTDNIEIVLNSIKNIKNISLFEGKVTIIGGLKLYQNSTRIPSKYQNNSILINKYSTSVNNLSDRESRRYGLYLGIFQEILKFDNEITRKFSKIFHKSFSDKDGTEIEQTVMKGFKFLELALALEMTERITYQTLSRNRKIISSGIDSGSKVIDENQIISNFSYLRMFQPVISHFGLTISGIGNKYNHDEGFIRYALTQRGFNGNFINEIINEYIYKHQELSLYIILYSLGLIYNDIKLMEKCTDKKIIEQTKLKNSFIYKNIFQLMNQLITLDEKIYSREENVDEKAKNDITRIKILKLVREFN